MINCKSYKLVLYHTSIHTVATNNLIVRYFMHCMYICKPNAIHDIRTIFKCNCAVLLVSNNVVHIIQTMDCFKCYCLNTVKRKVFHKYLLGAITTVFVGLPRVFSFTTQGCYEMPNRVFHHTPNF